MEYISFPGFLFNFTSEIHRLDWITPITDYSTRERVNMDFSHFVKKRIDGTNLENEELNDKILFAFDRESANFVWCARKKKKKMSFYPLPISFSSFFFPPPWKLANLARKTFKFTRKQSFNNFTLPLFNLIQSRLLLLLLKKKRRREKKKNSKTSN